MKKRMFIGIGIAVFITVFWLGIQTSRAGYETAEYEVVETDGKFQIRKYPQLTTVSTPSNTTK
ncbi:heme-binding protein, partial [bacterium]|nr:heme-binding protein [bacterium]